MNLIFVILLCVSTCRAFEEGIYTKDEADFDCLKKTNYKYAMIVANENGKLLKSFEANLFRCKMAKFECWAVINVCSACSEYYEQVSPAEDAMKRAGGHYIAFISIEDNSKWLNDLEKNKHFIDMCTVSLENSSATRMLLYSSNAATWNKAFGLDYKRNRERLVYYYSNQTTKDFNDFVPFGGWYAGEGKIITGEMKTKCDANFYEVISRDLPFRKYFDKQ